jgi:hypothetical protein
MFCGKCGTEVQSGVKFCGSCGEVMQADLAQQSNVGAVQTVTQNVKGIATQRIVLAILAVIGMIASFMPWFTVTVKVLGESESETINGIKLDGFFTLIIFIVILIIAILGKRTIALGKIKYLCCILGIITAFIGFVARKTNIDAFESESSLMYSQELTVGIGLYLVIFMGIGVILASFIKK